MEMTLKELSTSNPEERLERLDALIDKLFHLSPDEVDVLAQSYHKADTLMIEIVNVKPKSSMAMDLFEDVEFKPIDFPKELMPLLRRRDVFLVTVGWKKNRWKVLHMSHSYRTGGQK